MALADQERVVSIAAEAVGDRSILVAGVNCESSLEAARHARALEAAGADAIMVFPPNGWALHQDEEGVVEHHRRVLDATGAPLMLFQAAVGAGGLSYRPPTLERLVRPAPGGRHQGGKLGGRGLRGEPAAHPGRRAPGGGHGVG